MSCHFQPASQAQPAISLLASLTICHWSLPLVHEDSRLRVGGVDSSKPSSTLSRRLACPASHPRRVRSVPSLT
eukprot:scaffold28826_cov253-Isochrysis_galbana.AAC.2